MSIVLLYGAASLLAVCVATSSWMRRTSAARILSSLEELQRDSLIVVLGCPTRGPGGAANRYFVARVSAAAAAYHHASPETRDGGGVDQLLCSGWDEQGEASALRDALIAANVPATRIRVDGQAQRTIDSIDRVAAEGRDGPVVFVSQSFHLPRALYLARKRGIDGWGLPAPGSLHGFRPRIRESLAQLRAMLDIRFGR